MILPPIFSAADHSGHSGRLCMCEQLSTAVSYRCPPAVQFLHVEVPDLHALHRGEFIHVSFGP